MSRPPSAIGERIRSTRELVDGLSARSLSELAEQGAALVNHYERGVIQTPKYETIKRIAQVLGVSPLYLMEGEGDPPDAETVRTAVAKARADQKTDNGGAAA